MGFSRKEAPNCDLCPHRKTCLYALLDKASQREWKAIRIANHFHPGEVIFYEGERATGVYICCTGRVKIYKTSRSGQQLLLRFENPGDLVGHISLLAGWPYADNAEAMEDSIVSMVDAETFRRFLFKHPKAGYALLGELSKDVRRGEARARDIAFKPARARMAGTLVRLVPSPPPPNPVVSALKRKDLAEMAGLTIETTVRLLKDFETKGYIRRNGKDIALLNHGKLQSLAGQD